MRVAQAQAPVNGASSGRPFLSMEGEFEVYARPCHGQLPALWNLANENVNTGIPTHFLENKCVETKRLMTFTTFRYK